MTEQNERPEMEPEEETAGGASGFDVNKTLALVTGSLFNHAATAQSLRTEDPGWQSTLMALTVPLVVAAVVLGSLLSWIFGTVSMYYVGGVGMFFMLLVWAFLALGILALVTAIVAGVFGGTNNFNRAFAMASLVAVVGYSGSLLGTLPWIGWLLSLAVGIYSLVLFYRDVPVFLDVPQDKRVVHFIVTIVAVVVVNVVLSMVLRPAMPTAGIGDRSYGESGAGMPNIMGMNTELVARSMEDSYEPPEDGKLSDSQVKGFIEVMREANARQEEIAAELKELGEKEEGSISDMMRGFQGVTSLTTVEMEVVDANGGNWAEHQWVKQQLVNSRSQRGADAAAQHNYALVEKYQSDLKELVFMNF